MIRAGYVAILATTLPLAACASAPLASSDVEMASFYFFPGALSFDPRIDVTIYESANGIRAERRDVVSWEGGVPVMRVVRRAGTDARRCPALQRQTDLLRQLSSQPPFLTRPLPPIDGAMSGITLYAAGAPRSPGPDASASQVWVWKTLALLKPCWRDEPKSG